MQRATARHILSSQWHSDLKLTRAVMAAAAIQGCCGMELALMSQISRWQPAGNVNEYSGRMAIALGIVTSLVLAWSCYCCFCGYNMGRRTLDLTQE